MRAASKRAPVVGVELTKSAQISEYYRSKSYKAVFDAAKCLI